MLLGFGAASNAEVVADYAVQLSVEISTNPPQIRLTWPADPKAISYEIYRKSLTSSAWGNPVTLAASADSYVDSNVLLHRGYEYRVRKIAAGYDGEGYLYGGIEMPLVEARGVILLIVDKSSASGLDADLNLLRQDLIGDGWQVVRHDVSRQDSVATVKGIITAEYQTRRSTLKAVLLFGHVPVPYSGDLFPDGHFDHEGAWPADAYYGDLDGVWTDNQVNVTSGSSERNHNVPGDGKFDAVRLPSPIELQIGRVDLFDLPAFKETEQELLRRYLVKNHLFRHAKTKVSGQGLITDNLGLSTGEPFAASGWRNFSTFFGPQNIIASDWGTALQSKKFLWGYGCGSGDFSSAAGVVSTVDLSSRPQAVVFTMLFGSYFGDWDSRNNLLRAMIAADGVSLTSVWSGRPLWQFHHMALGEPIGYSALVNQNNTLYNLAAARFVHVALMGDPSLRMHPVAPPADLRINPRASGGYTLEWAAAAEPVVGYIVRRSKDSQGPFERLHQGFVDSTRFEDPADGAYVYSVTAVKLQISGSGSYFNSSQALFQSTPEPIPTLQFIQPTNRSVYIAPAEVSIELAATNPAGEVAPIELLANGSVIDTLASPPYRKVWMVPGAGEYALVARSTYPGPREILASVQLKVVAAEDSAPKLVNAPSLDREGVFRVTYRGVPGLDYGLARASSLTGPWMRVSRMSPDSEGFLTFEDRVDGHSAGFYRCIAE